MKPEVQRVISEQVETLEAQLGNVSEAVATGDVDKLTKALAIIEKVARVVLAVLGALSGLRAKK